MKRGRGSRNAFVVAALGGVVLGGVSLAPALAANAAGPASPVSAAATADGTAGATATPGKVLLPQAAPALPSNVKAIGPAPQNQVLDLDVTLAGQDPAGLAQAVAGVSTPGSPQYRRYLTAAQYAAEFGPSASEVAQVSSALSDEGLTVGTPQPGSTLLPVSGSVATVAAAFETPMETVQSSSQSHALVNTAAPQIPASLSGSGHRGGRPERSLSGALHAPAFAVARRLELGRRHPRQPGPRARPCRDATGLRGGAGPGVRRGLHLDANGVGVRSQPALRAGPYRPRTDDRCRRVRAVPVVGLPGVRVLLRTEQLDPKHQHRRRTAAGRRVAGKQPSMSSSRRSTRRTRRCSSTRHPTTTTPHPSTCSTPSPARTPHPS